MKYPLFPTYLFLNRTRFLIKKCMKTKSLRPCKQIHALLLASGIDMKTDSLNSTLVGLYARCGDVGSAKLIFQQSQNPCIFAFNWMISALAFNGYCEEAIGYFYLVERSNLSPNSYTLSVVLKACVGLMDVKNGKELHAMAYRKSFVLDTSVGNALIDMYCKCGSVSNGRKVFDGMSQRDVASWTSMICGYSNVGQVHQSLDLFERMKLDGLEPNEFTWNAIIVAHARQGDCSGALSLFSRMTTEGLVPDLATWNAMISGFVESHQNDKAVKLFNQMLESGVKPNEVTVTGLLPLCGLTGSLTKGKVIHGVIYRLGLYINAFVGSALVDMYSKCGSVTSAQNTFNNIPFKNVSLWNAMIGCYGKNGMVDLAINLFERMQTEGIQANEVTLTCVLSACSHGGFLEKGLEIFMFMRENYGISESKEHYSCVMDLLCRLGRMEDAYELVKIMQKEVTNPIIGAFLNGCKIHKRIDLAEKLEKEILNMELTRPEGLVTLSNIYAADGKWEEVENVRNFMKEKGIQKDAGFSWVQNRDKSNKLDQGKEKRYD